uniref:Uncharacterized protein n=1 Tax=Parascaris equorum TaxID=6256 RepID=A0A914RAT9_PAREQ
MANKRANVPADEHHYRTQRNPVKAKKILSMMESKKGYLTQGPTKRK